MKIPKRTILKAASRRVGRANCGNALSYIKERGYVVEKDKKLSLPNTRSPREIAEQIVDLLPTD